MGDKVEFLGEEIRTTAQDRIHHRPQPRLTVTRIILQGLSQEKGFYIIVLVGLGFCLWRDWLIGRTGNIAITKAYLCCVNAKLGHPSAAAKFLDEARAYLIATGETKLLKDCEEALGKKVQLR